MLKTLKWLGITCVCTLSLLWPLARASSSQGAPADSSQTNSLIAARGAQRDVQHGGLPQHVSQPKYPVGALPLSTHHDYLRKHDAPSFWALVPYYTAQYNETSCSLASAVMILNAARQSHGLEAREELVTQAGLLGQLNATRWNDAVADDGPGMGLQDLKILLEEALRHYGLAHAKVTPIIVDSKSASLFSPVHQALLDTARSRKTLLIANFDQAIFLHDMHVGHFAPVGAYDAQLKRVLVMDPDRRWYEPYWVDEDNFVAGMGTVDDESKQPRGLIRIDL